MQSSNSNKISFTQNEAKLPDFNMSISDTNTVSLCKSKVAARTKTSFTLPYEKEKYPVHTHQDQKQNTRKQEIDFILIFSEHICSTF